MSRLPFHRRLVMATRFAIFGARNAYDAAAMHRLFSAWIASARHPDEEVRSDSRQLRARARELARNNSYAKRYLRLLESNVVGPMGIRLQALVRKGNNLDESTNDAIEVAWNAWANEPVTIDGKLTLNQIEKLLRRTWDMDGEVFVRFWRGTAWNRFGLAIQPIDADMIDVLFNRHASPGENEIRMGIEIDSVGRTVAYHVWESPVMPGLQVMGKRIRIQASEIVHLYTQTRVNQTRGITALHAAMAPAHMLNGYEESEAVAARIAASKMGFISTRDDSMGVGMPGDGTTTKAAATMEASPGTFEELVPGQTVIPFDPQHPTSQFSAFVKQSIRKIATGLNVFSNVLANDAEGVTYSTMRSFSLVERDDWRTLQQEFIESWRRPLYNAWLRMALTTGALPLPAANFERYLEVRHRPRGWSWIDPQSEVRAACEAIASGLGSRTSFLAEKGEDIEDVFAELKRERERAKEYGIDIDGEPGEEQKLTEQEWEAKKDVAGGGKGDGRELAETPKRRPSPPSRLLGTQRAA